MWAMRPKKGQSQIKWVAAIPTACSTTAAAPLPRARSVAIASAFTSSWSRLRRKVPSGVQSGHVEMPVRRRTSGKSASMQSWDAAQVSVTASITQRPSRTTSVTQQHVSVTHSINHTMARTASVKQRLTQRHAASVTQRGTHAVTQASCQSGIS